MDDVINMFEDLEEDKEEMLDLNDWTWETFRDAFKQFVEMFGNEDMAWRIIYETWQIRAGEKIPDYTKDGNTIIDCKHIDIAKQLYETDES